MIRIGFFALLASDEAMFPAKFCHLDDDGEHIPHDYGDVYFQQPCEWYERLVIGPSKDHVALMLDLAALFAGHPWYLLYVLLVPREGGHAAGRYGSPAFKDHNALSEFVREYGDFFEGDGRHHLWISSPADGGLLVYDKHNVIFGYGPLAEMRAVLEAREFTDQEFWYPYPHSHFYLPSFDAEVERLMRALAWTHSELRPDDEGD
jgi:hypothetical protein